MLTVPKIVDDILAMVKADQAMRKQFQQDKISWDQRMDQRHAERMKQIIVEIGWPTISKVGKSASNGSWLLVQHADHDLQFQKFCLQLLKNIEKDYPHEISLEQIAFLEDRIMVSELGKQRFGTQCRTLNNGSIAAWPIEDEEHVNTRRKQYGLEPLEQYIAYMNKK